MWCSEEKRFRGMRFLSAFLQARTAHGASATTEGGRRGICNASAIATRVPPFAPPLLVARFGDAKACLAPAPRSRSCSGSGGADRDNGVHARRELLATSATEEARLMTHLRVS
jgi:hypothetical protein